MKKLLTVLLLSLSAIITAQAQQKLLTQSEISFVSKQMGVPVEGKFTKFDAQLAFDPKKPETSKVNFTVDLTSANLGNADTEKELKKPGWFDSAKVPVATFTSSSVKAIGAGKYEFTGKLTIKGLTQNLTVPVSLTQKEGVTKAEGSFVLKRLDFKIGDGEWNDTSLVANEVTVKVKLNLSGIPSV
ncbi:MAG: YceI family protein [Burkholderiaceae bacterium]|nr:YceI family protein [Burkholderiaceae bacterium]